MTTKLKRRMAQQFYDDGFSLFQQGQYEQAVAELRQAEDIFRTLDARGHPFSYSLVNGVSGLSNTLALEGRCYLKLGDFRQAISYYEGSLVNAKFEKKSPFQLFQAVLQNEIASCYEKELEKIDPEKLRVLKQNPELDISFLFPFSLPQDLVPIARLYELAPDRYPHIGEFYTTTKKQDSKLRRMDKMSDESAMKKLSFYVWGTLVSIWIAYGLFVLLALAQRK